MDHTNAKQVTKMLLATCFVMVIIAGGAFALANVFSNHETDQVTVPADEIVISTLTALPDATAQGVAYELTFTVDYLVSVTDAYAVLVISAPGIAEGDVTVSYPPDNLGTVIAGTGTLTFEFGIPETDGTVTFLVTFNNPGTYSTDLSVEAAA